jgi:outer membrane protein OmpA-like peptidoglycan-associated protein
VTGPAEPNSGGAPHELDDLRKILVGEEQRAIAELRRRLDLLELTPEEVAEQLPDAIALGAARDDRLARALAPTLEDAITESVQRNPQQIAQAIYPSLGPAIRKAISEALAGLVAGINKAIEHSLSWQGLQWRVEAWRTGVPYPQVVMSHALVYRVEQAYLIHGETSLLLAHVAAPDLAAPDADLVSGMLTAIRDFVSDSFGGGGNTGGGLRTFTVGELTVVVEPGPRALLAAVVRGQAPPSLLERLQRTLEDIHFQFAGPLGGFAGDAAPFEAAKPLLAECLERELHTDRPRQRSATLRIAWGVAALLAVVLLSVVVLGQLRWRRGLAALRAQPGLVVLEADRGLRGGRITGLRDPLAADPQVVLAGLGLDTGRVRGSWTPFLSADGPIVVARARRVMAASPSVTFTLAGDTLVAAGSADPAWFAGAAQGAAAVPGVAHLDVSRVRLRWPAGLQPVADAIERSLVLFLPGSAELDAAAAATVRAAAEGLRLLQTAAVPPWVATVDIVGRTDTTGTDAVNRSLSRERAQAVARALVRLGVTEAVIAPEGVATNDPLPAGDDGDAARVNRSVQLTVRLRQATPQGESGP